jgi:hypothetical protein
MIRKIADACTLPLNINKLEPWIPQTLRPLAHFSILWDARGLVVEVRLQQQHRCSLLMVPLAAHDVAVPAAVAGSWGAGPGLASLGEEANLQTLPGKYWLWLAGTFGACREVSLQMVRSNLLNPQILQMKTPSGDAAVVPGS